MAGTGRHMAAGPSRDEETEHTPERDTAPERTPDQGATMQRGAVPLRSVAPSRQAPAKYTMKAKRRKGARHVVSNLLLIVGIILLVVAGGMFAYQQYSYHEQDVVNADLAQYAVVEPDTPEEQCPVDVDWDGLRAINDDIVGWIYVGGTPVSFPVYQGEDNEHYLRHNAEGTWTIGGQIFLDCDNTAPGLVDQQSLIYGHHLNNGAMFEPLSRMDQQDTFDAATDVWYITPDGATRLLPLFFYDTDRDDAEARTLTFESEDAFHTYLADRCAKAVTRRAGAETTINGVSKIMTLSTCVYYSKYAKGHGRGLLVCAPYDEVVAAEAAAAQ